MSLKKKVPLSSGGGGGGFLAKTKESSSEIKEGVEVGEIAKNRLHVSRKSDGRATKWTPTKTDFEKISEWPRARSTLIPD